MSARGSTDPLLLILVSLAAGPKHGHAILLDVESFAGVRLGPGTLVWDASAVGYRLATLSGTVRAGLERVGT